jgi:serine acetyltransferase
MEPIKVGSNVFLGSGVIILSGVKIGDNVVIGSGAVVTKDIPSNCVAAGIPARSIKSIEEYFRDTKAKTLNVKKMKPKEKKAFLLNYFCPNNREDPPVKNI